MTVALSIALAVACVAWLVVARALAREVRRWRRMHARLLELEQVVDALCQLPGLTCEHGLLHTVHCLSCAREGDRAEA